MQTGFRTNRTNTEGKNIALISGMETGMTCCVAAFIRVSVMFVKNVGILVCCANNCCINGNGCERFFLSI